MRIRPGLRGAFAGALMGIVALACGAPAAPSTFVDDAAGILAPDSVRRLEELLAAVLRDTDVELRVATLPALDGTPIRQRADELFESGRVGARTRGDRGLLLLVAVAERQARLVVGYELEPHFPDAFVGTVERDQLAQYFAGGALGEGVEATAELLARRAEEEIAGGALDPVAVRAPPNGPRAGGAGAGVNDLAFAATAPEPAAETETQAGTARESAAALAERFAAQPTPELAWQRFLEIQRRHVKAIDLGLYDDAAQAILAARPNSDAAQDHLARLYGEAPFEAREEGDRAAIVFRDDPRHLLAPWFWHRAAGAAGAAGDEGWQLDGAAVRELVRYNHLNQWRLARLDSDYAFAFADFRFDRNGFAFPR